MPALDATSVKVTPACALSRGTSEAASARKRRPRHTGTTRGARSARQVPAAKRLLLHLLEPGACPGALIETAHLLIQPAERAVRLGCGRESEGFLVLFDRSIEPSALCERPREAHVIGGGVRLRRDNLLPESHRLLVRAFARPSASLELQDRDIDLAAALVERLRLQPL